MAFEGLGDKYNSGFGKEIDDNLDRGNTGGRRKRPQQTPPLSPPPESPVKPFVDLLKRYQTVIRKRLIILYQKNIKLFMVVEQYLLVL